MNQKVFRWLITTCLIFIAAITTYLLNENNPKELYAEKHLHSTDIKRTTIHVQEPILSFDQVKHLSLKYDFAITDTLKPWTEKDLEFFKTAAGETLFSQLTLISEPNVAPNFAMMTAAERLFKSLFMYFDQRLSQNASLDESWPYYKRLEDALYPWIHPHWENLFHINNQTSGQGIVMCVGNGQFKFAATSIRVIRMLNTKLPIEVFFIREDDLSVAKRYYLKSEMEHVTLRKLDDYISDYYTKFGGWAMKPFAMLASRFTEVILVDADAYFLQDPALLFQDQAYALTGALFFYDRTLFPNWHVGPDWLRSFLPTMSSFVPQTRWFKYTSSHEQESGVVVMNKRKSLLGLLSTCKLNGKSERDEVVYKHVHGDKETFWIGHEIMQTPYAFIKSFGAVIGNMGHGGQDGEPTQVCGVQLHLDTTGTPLWFNGGLYRNKYKETLEYLNFTHFAQGDDWEFETHCIKNTDKIHELSPDQRSIALAAIELDKQREKDERLLEQGLWKPKKTIASH
ncbi:hypothetical protein G6F70_004236 [Rhizopus microsporus]|uniref:Uncharacterized protein n=2 Tax=Rhizopus TaxID=4842 RepID=A0A367JZG9_RHIAZ|nr:hypothetical protein G6F71_003604 [Rhizopus microsporus]RCH95297.1 hypothetical protein CU097_013885 [Rhizopus azygosporus]KAG1200232.1 hypothetical protein G6F70_004236 [Rhizopus microsporus]KAG1211920.1 hypothetical protein G6F69_004179 [Rhizopus microsporus]KAG1233859.1 hypothetical protein G6F67_003981 [Rhizopus microsporus]